MVLFRSQFLLYDKSKKKCREDTAAAVVDVAEDEAVEAVIKAEITLQEDEDIREEVVEEVSMQVDLPPMLD